MAGTVGRPGAIPGLTMPRQVLASGPASELARPGSDGPHLDDQGMIDNVVAPDVINTE